jgi:serine/threonine-protein kinase 24/25/MST4
VFNIYCTCREESKQDSDLDEPWIMTVKGPHSIKPPNDEPANHKIPQKVQNGSGPPQTKSPPKDSNLNHYRSEKATPVSIVMCLEKR